MIPRNTMATLLLLSSTLYVTSTHAETDQEATVRKLVGPKLAKNTKIDTVTKTPYSGLFEVHVGAEIIYTDKDARYLIVGNIIDADNATNYTKQRIDEINKIRFSDLPLDSALKMVKGDGKRVMATFEDPNCGPCKQLRKNIQTLDNVTVYTFMYNILAEDSAEKSKNIWCSGDKNKAWDEWMLYRKLATVADINCANPNEKVLALGKKLRVNATPTTVFMDGSRLTGAVDAKALEGKLITLERKLAAIK
jgi:thiol:disulfide interchange protein DsbC